MSINILGISAFYHDSAACIVSDGEIVAAAQEERFTRKKGDDRFPASAVQYCLQHAGLRLDQINQSVFYDRPDLKYARLKSTYLAYAPKGIDSFVESMSLWLLGKKDLKKLLQQGLARIPGYAGKMPPISFVEHHLSHAASAFFPSPFHKAGVLCMDGVGEWTTTSVWSGAGNRITPQWTLEFPHSLGLLYSAFTYYTGFKVNSGEYKVMGLAPYGKPKYVQLILEHLIDVKADGTFRMNMDYFDYPVGFRMTNDRFSQLFGGPPREPETTLSQKDMDIARSIQEVVEEVVLRLARTLRRETGHEHLCIAGGVGLNCVVNGRLLRSGLYKDIWIQPAAGDAGGSLGAAMAFWYHNMERPRKVNPKDSMKGALLGPAYRNEEIQQYLDTIGAKYTRMNEDALLNKVAKFISKGLVVGWFHGRMEYGPRSLGTRSIIGDARNPKMQQTMNLKIKFRESFRPFAPSVLAEKVSDYFELDRPSPYMLLVAQVKGELCRSMTDEQKSFFGIEQLNVIRSTIPAVTHIDYSARIQTVDVLTNPRFYKLIQAFEACTGCPVVVNTSFNVRSEPIVCTPEDAYRCFMRTQIDYLVLEDYLLDKREQPQWKDDERWKMEFELD